MTKSEASLQQIESKLEGISSNLYKVYYGSNEAAELTFSTLGALEANDGISYREAIGDATLRREFPGGKFNAIIFVGIDDTNVANEVGLSTSNNMTALTTAILDVVTASGSSIVNIAVKVTSAEWIVNGVLDAGTAKLSKAICFKGDLYYEEPA
jgi:hypothetical protein